MTNNITISKREHQTWKDWTRIPHGLVREPIIGRWQYIVKSERGEISIVELPNYFRDGKTLWEIYSIEGNLFEDVERFDTYGEAEEAARNYLND